MALDGAPSYGRAAFRAAGLCSGPATSEGPSVFKKKPSLGWWGGYMSAGGEVAEAITMAVAVVAGLAFHSLWMINAGDVGRWS